VLVVGSSMDSGKTTAAAALINGLTRAGRRVGAAKITGTASLNDVQTMRDAGAVEALDFTNAGYGSTADLGKPELVAVLDCLLARLASGKPEVVVLELADGVMQRETAALLEHLAAVRLASAVLYTCNDALAAARGVEWLQRQGLPVAAVSGTVTASPLGVAEVKDEVALPVLTKDELRQTAVATDLARLRDTMPRAVAAG
jgi:hypothetical protein